MLIRGTLQLISPATKPSLPTKKLVYEGRVTLEQDQYEMGDTVYWLRPGITAIAEIMVRKRRLIDLVGIPDERDQ